MTPAGCPSLPPSACCAAFVGYCRKSPSAPAFRSQRFRSGLVAVTMTIGATMKPRAQSGFEVYEIGPGRLQRNSEVKMAVKRGYEISWQQREELERGRGWG